ncbi:MAG: hypothetical protein E7484_00065 [Ruminococcaceae bacterium]|nr:hypothetical protein [Oscillospiraceae bacterium]
MARYLSPEAKQRRIRRRRAKRIALAAFLVAFILVVSYGIVAVIEAFTPENEGEHTLINPEQVTDLEPNTSLETEGEWTGFVGPVQQTINNFEIVAPDHRMLQLPENGSVDLSYFENVTFVGDSLTEGLRIYSSIENSVANISTFVSAKSLSPKSFLEGVITNFENNYRPAQNGVEAIIESWPSKVYITLGTNALVYMTDEQFIYYYDQLLTRLKYEMPNVLFYVCSVTPTTAEYAAAKPNFAWDRMYRVNNQIAKMCSEKGMHYINLHEALAGEDGYLKHEYAAKDGIHLKPEAYEVWIQYLMTHTVHRSDNPYIIGSPYYNGSTM